MAKAKKKTSKKAMNSEPAAEVDSKGTDGQEPDGENADSVSDTIDNAAEIEQKCAAIESEQEGAAQESCFPEISKGDVLELLGKQCEVVKITPAIILLRPKAG